MPEKKKYGSSYGGAGRYKKDLDAADPDYQEKTENNEIDKMIEDSNNIASGETSWVRKIFGGK